MHHSNNDKDDAGLGSASAAPVSKDQMVTHIKRWIQLDNEIKKTQEELKARKDERKQHTLRLVDIMKSNEIDCFDINNGKLLYTKTKVKAPLSKGQLMQALANYYNNDEEQVRELGDHLMAARQEKVTETIRRKTSK
jgi:hypothetical protein